MSEVKISFHPLSVQNLSAALSVASGVFPYNIRSIEAAYRDSLDPLSERMKKRRLLAYFVATNDMTGKVIAVTGLYNHLIDHSPDEAWLGWFCVDPTERGKGFGRKTLEWTIERARDMGYKMFRLYTSTDSNEREAQSLYESEGLAIYKREPSEEHPGEEIIYRELSLA
ncbi:MAG: GNAT family N-acetyltransferase [Patescibacteria group bacterium]|nr:GNAT family N-acetyltransferase [Patescibacteria group bacterium]MDE2116259.1 GNAT family N-acetyltransferase [Patescibacteria group bacterium]